MSQRIARVAVPAPLHALFDYRVPQGLSVPAGSRVRVSFGRSRKIGVVVETVAHSDLAPASLKPIEAVLDEAPLLQAEDLDFLRWAAGYYHHPVGEVIAGALPLRLRKAEVANLPVETRWTLTRAGAGMAAAAPARAPRQAELLRWLAGPAGGSATARDLRDAMPWCPPVLKALAAKGWLAAERQPLAPDAVVLDAEGPALSAAQRDVVNTLCADDALQRFGVALLDGVTGSGKTEIYLRAAAEVLRRGRSVLVLVPEIALTPQLSQRFRERLGPTVRVLHSALSDGEREAHWHRVRSGLSRVLLGTRSSVFVPVAELGLVVVDEEHDASFKQAEGFRYSARDLAVVRAQRAGCPVILGSATPSLESLRHALGGHYRHLRLDRRAGGARSPRIDLLDMRDQPSRASLSQPLLERIGQTLASGRQAMVFLNRRGFAPVVSCFDCGWLSDCPRCDARQTLHRAAGMLWCHHCGAQRRLPAACPACGGAELHPLGAGTEQLEAVLAERFPAYPLIRLDRDATARRGELERRLERLRAADAALVVGTQMLAKGHDFPGVTLVGVVDADGGLYSADFRATERLAQLLVQVAGRAGRGPAAGHVLIQTRFPDHPLLQTLLRDGYRAFARAALRERAAAGLPPFCHQALLRADAGRLDSAQAFVQRLADRLAAGRDCAVECWGPVPAPMTRRAGRHRVHLLLQSKRRDRLHAALRGLTSFIAAADLPGGVRWSLDVDPLDLY